ncbi:hypothetical protein [Kitasatospora sp. NPDC056184]
MRHHSGALTGSAPGPDGPGDGTVGGTEGIGGTAGRGGTGGAGGVGVV